MKTCQNWINFAEHQNWFGLDDNLGPVAISIRREKVPISALTIAGSSANNVNNNGGNINNGNVSSMENGSSGSSSLAPSIGEKEQFMYRIMVRIFIFELI